MSDPAVHKMNETQWTFELIGLVERDKKRYDDISSIMKTSRSALIDLLGLNLMPIEDEFTDADSGEILTKLRRPEEDEIMPLSLICGNETLLAELSKLHNELRDQEITEEKIDSGEVVELNPDELDDFMSEGDITFPDDPVELEKHLQWNSLENKNILKYMVKPLDEKDVDLDPPNLIEGERKKASRLTVK